MAFTLLLFSRIAKTAIIASVMASMTMAQTTKGSDSGLNSIDVAVSAHNKIFGWYIVVLTGTVVF